MITEEQIPEIVDSMNQGGEPPAGVTPYFLRRSANPIVYSHIHFEGLGFYYVIGDPIRLKTEEEFAEYQNNEA